MKYVLVINPGSTSTKIAIYSTESMEIHTEVVEHNVEALKAFEHIIDQSEVRREEIVRVLREKKIGKEDLACVVGRGGLLRPIRGGTYLVDMDIVNDLKAAVQGEHASNLGPILAKEIADEAGVEAYIVDPVACDEMDDVARFTGLKGEERGSLAHYLNIKGVTRKVCEEEGFSFYEDNFIVAHLGGGFSIGPLKKGRLVDVNNANHGGPFSPERVGTLPLGVLVKYAFSGEYDKKSLLRKFQRSAGLVSHLGTSDAREVERMIHDGDDYAAKVYEAMAYQIAKEIGASAAVLKGDVKAIIMTGGLAYSSMLMGMVEEYVKFIAPVVRVPGELEMKSLYEGARRVLSGEEKPLRYREEILSEKF